jgi:hypothetical protein
MEKQIIEFANPFSYPLFQQIKKKKKEGKTEFIIFPFFDAKYKKKFLY